jgi:endonuclease/exonuclease/phosphatase (EEP) superfamily protein YafD
MCADRFPSSARRWHSCTARSRRLRSAIIRGRATPIACASSTTLPTTHGLRTEDGKGDNGERDAQAAALARLIRSVWPGGERLVVCGDLNVLPGGRIFQVLGKFGLTDLVTSRGFAGTRTSLYRKPERFADYMLVTPDVRVLGFDVVRQPEVSDHCPLLLHFA